MNSLDPILISAKQTIDTLKIALGNINSIFDASTKAHLKKTIANLETTTEEITVLLNSKDGALAKTINNAETFSANLNKNNE